jgi:hypothetical protein
MPPPGKRRHRSKLGELPKVLSGGGEKEFISGAVGAAQSEAAKPEDALLDLLPATPFVGRRARQSSGDITSTLIEIARHVALRRVIAAFRLEGWQSDLLKRYGRAPSLVMPERGVA